VDFAAARASFACRTRSSTGSSPGDGAGEVGACEAGAGEDEASEVGAGDQGAIGALIICRACSKDVDIGGVSVCTEDAGGVGAFDAADVGATSSGEGDPQGEKRPA
jgi:hypothetical protein